MNKVILLCLPPHTTHLLQPLDIGLFAPLSVYYKNNIRDNTKFGYNYSVDKLAFLESYCRARDSAFTTENIQKAWKKSGLEPFCPSVVVGTLEPASFPELLSTSSSGNSTSRPTTQGGPIPNLYTNTPVHIGDIRQILELQRQGRLEDIHTVLTKICKAAEKAIAQRLILANHNKELQEAAIRKKARANRKGGNLSPDDARVYDAKSLVERAYWANQQFEGEVIAKFISFSLTIFDFKPKKPRAIRVPDNYQPKTTTLALRPTTTLAILFQSLVKKLPTKLKKPPNPLKITKPTKPKVVVQGHGVRKQVAKMITVKCRGEGVGQAVQVVQVRVQSLIKTSSRGRKIRPTIKAI
jgi:hypothetical protein